MSNQINMKCPLHNQPMIVVEYSFERPAPGGFLSTKANFYGECGCRMTITTFDDIFKKEIDEWLKK